MRLLYLQWQRADKYNYFELNLHSLRMTVDKVLKNWSINFFLNHEPHLHWNNCPKLQMLFCLFRGYYAGLGSFILDHHFLLWKCDYPRHQTVEQHSSVFSFLIFSFVTSKTFAINLNIVDSMLASSNTWLAHHTLCHTLNISARVSYLITTWAHQISSNVFRLQ